MKHSLRWLTVLGMSASCSLQTFPYAKCTSNQDCRDAFGWGSVCSLEVEGNTEGLCDVVKPQPRCDTYPTNLIQRRSEFDNAIIIGIQFDKSAFNAEMQAARLAVTEVMLDSFDSFDGVSGVIGGLDGQPYGLVECTNEESPLYDELTQDEANLVVSEYLANQIGVVGMIGPATSSRVNSAFLEVEQYGTLLITPSATSPALTPLDGIESTFDSPGLLWRTVPPDDLQGVVLSQYLIQRGIDTVAAIYEEGEYGGALSSVFLEAYTAAGGQAKSLAYQPNNAQSLKTAMDGVQAQEAVLFVSSTKTDTIAFLEEVVNDSFGDKPIFLADGGQDVELFEAVEGIENRFVQIEGTAPASEQTAVYQSFAASYWSQFTEEADQTPYTGRAYDAAWLLIYGTAWAHYQEAVQGSAINGLGAARGLRMVSDPNGPQIDIGPTQWNLLRAQFEQGNRVNIRGASGPLDFDAQTGETSSAIDIWSIRDPNENGRFEVVVLQRFDP